MQFRLDEAVVMLRRTPGVLRAVLSGLPAGWTDSPYGPGTWSAREVVAHLIHGEETDWIPRARVILERGESEAFAPFDRAGHEGLCSGKGVGELLDLLEAARGRSLAALAAMRLTEADLNRRGRHPAFGVVTLRQLLSTWVVHDLNHVSQVCKAMAYQYREQVGPWEAYLSILSPPSPR